MKQAVLVVCVDRDNDLGQKTGIFGPLLGKKAILNAAAKLAVSDPEESDANAMFASVKKFEEIKHEFKAVEVACLTGVDKSGFRSDRQIAEQLDTILEKFPADALVLVTDGAEDDQVIPVLQSRIPILSKQQIVIRQAHEVESTFYTIKEALKDPFIARVVFGVPGIILMLYFLVGNLSLQIVSFVLGVYLLIKGFGIEEILVKTIGEFKNNFSIQRTSFPFFVGGTFVLVFAVLTAYASFVSNAQADPVTNAVQALQHTYLLLFLAGESFVLGRSIDQIHLKKAFRIPDQLLVGISLFLLWLILDAGTEVFLKRADLNWFLTIIILSFAILLLTYRFTKSIDLRKKISPLLEGLPVYNNEGKWVGKVKKVYAEKELLEYSEHKTKESKQVDNTKFRFIEGKIVLNG